MKRTILEFMSDFFIFGFRIVSGFFIAAAVTICIPVIIFFGLWILWINAEE